MAGVLEQRHEIRAAHVNEAFMIARLEEHLRLIREAVIHDGLEAVGSTQRRNGAQLAIGEQVVRSSASVASLSLRLSSRSSLPIRTKPVDASTATT